MLLTTLFKINHRQQSRSRVLFPHWCPWPRGLIRTLDMMTNMMTNMILVSATIICGASANDSVTRLLNKTAGERGGLFIHLTSHISHHRQTHITVKILHFAIIHSRVVFYAAGQCCSFNARRVCFSLRQLFGALAKELR